MCVHAGDTLVNEKKKKLRLQVQKKMRTQHWNTASTVLHHGCTHTGQWMWALVGPEELDDLWNRMNDNISRYKYLEAIKLKDCER